MKATGKQFEPKCLLFKLHLGVCRYLTTIIHPPSSNNPLPLHIIPKSHQLDMFDSAEIKKALHRNMNILNNHFERALSPTLLSLWPPETGTHSQPPSSPRLITFICLRSASTDTFNSYPAHKIPLFFFSRWRGQSRPLGDAPFRCISFSHQFL